MRYHNITKDDMLNGDGLRVVLWLSGCEHRCPECQNPVTWDIDGGLSFDDAAKQEVFDELEKDYISGITFSGGDPLHPANRAEVGNMIAEIKQKYPEKTIWMYTGYTWEELQSLPYLSDINVLVDGRFVAKLKDNQLCWRGSANQRVINVRESLKQGRVVLLVKDEKSVEYTVLEGCQCSA